MKSPQTKEMVIIMDSNLIINIMQSVKTNKDETIYKYNHKAAQLHCSKMQTLPKKMNLKDYVFLKKMRREAQFMKLKHIIIMQTI